MNSETNAQYTHVCCKCETPQLITRKAGLGRLYASFRDSLLLTFAMIVPIYATLFIGFLALPVWGLYLYVVYLSLRFNPKCEKCGERELIPVDSPRAKIIMEKNGWEAL